MDLNLSLKKKKKKPTLKLNSETIDCDDLSYPEMLKNLYSQMKQDNHTDTVNKLILVQPKINYIGKKTIFHNILALGREPVSIFRYLKKPFLFSIYCFLFNYS